ncbi:MAG: hypothetical protein GX891_03780 [Clostridiales bacterium]|nr:hypothetical protein [Clostridiales bacterium]
MKKLLLTLPLVLIVAAALFSFTACNNATPQGQLGDYFAPYEKYTYLVTDNNAETPVTGVYTVEIKKFKKDSIVTLAQGEVLNGVPEGHLIKGRLEIADTVIEQSCYVDNVNGNSFLVPRASFKRVSKNGALLYESLINYTSGVSYKLKTSADDIKVGNLSVPAPYYDNNEFMTMLRGASTMGSGFAMTYNVPVVTPSETASAQLTASCSGTEGITVPFKEEAIDCFAINISRQTIVAGTTYNAYYAASQIEINGRKLTRVLVKFVEDKVVYELKEIITVEDNQ